MYPPELVEAIVMGLQIQREHDHRIGRSECPVSRALEQAMMPDEEELQAIAMARQV